MKYAIETCELTKFYRKTKGIENLSLQIEEGEIFGFIGPNGAGKSTTIRTLLGLLRPTNGNATVLGKDIMGQMPEILSQVGYLPSESLFYPGMKVRDILKFSASLRKMNCEKEANELCDRLELDISRPAEELSFGNRKKVSIVCALQHNPKLLILDEPTSGLDPLMQREFFSIVKERNYGGCTIFLSSHILSEVQRNCVRAGVIRNGNLIACDRVQNFAKTNAKRVSVHGTVDLSELRGICDLNLADNSANFLFNGDPKELLACLAAGNIQDFSVTEPDLEEIFMHYYAEEGNK